MSFTKWIQFSSWNDDLKKILEDETIEKDEVTGIETISNDIFKIIRKSGKENNIIESILEINVEELNKLDESYISKDSITRVTLVSENKNDDNAIYNVLKKDEDYNILYEDDYFIFYERLV